MTDSGTAVTPRTTAAAVFGKDRLPPGVIRLDVAEQVHNAVEELLAAEPPSWDGEASLRWLAAAEEVVPMAGDHDRARLLDRCSMVRANLATDDRSGGARDFHKDAQTAGELYEGMGDMLAAATNYASAAVAAVQAEQIGEALESAVRALVAFSAIPASECDAIGEARMANMLGVLCYQFFDYERSLQFYEISLRCLAAPEESARRTVAMHNVVEVALLQAHEMSLDDPGREELLRRAEELVEAIMVSGEEGPVRAVDAPRLRALILCERGHAEQAWALLEVATRAAGNPPHRGQVAALRLARGRCLQLLGRPVEALVELDEALELFDVDWDLAEFIIAVQLRSLVREQAGDVSGALEDSRRLSEQLWLRHQRQVGGFMDQVWSRAGVESERRDLEARAIDLLRSAEQDPLTGLANRRALERFCAAMPAHERICLVLVDVDHFKTVNDRYGHGLGDHVLQIVSQLLARSVRSVDRVARWGGEEFLLALPSNDPDFGIEVATRLRRRIADHEWNGVALGLTLTVSAGVAFGTAGEAAEVLARADIALYEAKRAGRNRVRAA